MEEVKRGPWLEEVFTKEGESYIVNDGWVEGFRASITPREEGFFDLEVYRYESEYVRDDDIGIHVETSRQEYLKTQEFTVDGMKTAVQEFGLSFNEDLVNQLAELQKKFSNNNEIEMGYMPEGVEAPEEISERLRLELGSALAEAQGITEYESRLANLERSSMSEDQARAQSFYEDLKAAGFEIRDYTQDEYELLMSRAEVEQEERRINGFDGWMESEAIAKEKGASLAERSSLDNDHAQGQSVELEDGEDHSFSF